jgi:hypothetical protein
VKWWNCICEAKTCLNLGEASAAIDAPCRDQNPGLNICKCFGAISYGCSDRVNCERSECLLARQLTQSLAGDMRKLWKNKKLPADLLDDYPLGKQKIASKLTLNLPIIVFEKIVASVPITKLAE